MIFGLPFITQSQHVLEIIQEFNTTLVKEKSESSTTAGFSDLLALNPQIDEIITKLDKILCSLVIELYLTREKAYTFCENREKPQLTIQHEVFWE